MSNSKLKRDRKLIDKIDDKIFQLIKKRTRVVDHMLSLKKFKNQIIDQRRIKEILKKIKNKSTKNKMDLKTTERIWKSIIWSYVEYQRKNFKKK